MARTKSTAGRGRDRNDRMTVLRNARLANGGVKPDHENDFDNLLDDLSKKGRAVGADADGADEDDTRGKGKKPDADESDDSDEDTFDFDSKRNRHGRNRRGEEEEEEEASYMLFDFRRGREQWPSNVEMVDSKRYEELLLAATAAAEAAAKKKKKTGGDGDDDGDFPIHGSPSGKGKGKSSGGVSWDSFSFDDENDKVDESDVNKRDVCPADAVFETLGDGSTALILPPGYRLKINCEELLKGGDKKREERIKEASKAKRRKTKYRSSWGGFGNTGTSSGWDDWDTKKFGFSKEYINQYTITMDIKILEEPGRDGVALYQTALIHSKESKRQGGKLTLSKSDGECFINQVGGVGTFGTFGDTTKARVKKGQWQRVVISVHCSDNENVKGEMRTWVGVEPGVILKEEAFTANERFAIDPENLYLFSSAQSSMMPGNIAIRMIRIDQRISSDVDVKSFRARDKVNIHSPFVEIIDIFFCCAAD
jgi:hypothetical protein